MNASPMIALPQLKNARLSVMAIFFINGAILASFVPHIPFIQQKHQLSEGFLGLTLLSLSLGAMCTLFLAGWLISRFGSRTMTRVAGIIFCLTLPLPILAPSFPLLILGMIFMGASNGLMDVSMNTQAVSIERGLQKPIISSFHALYSLGGLVGASVGALALSLGVTPLQHVFGITILMFIGLVFSLIRLLPSSLDGAAQKTVFILPQGALLALSLLGLGTMLSEGAIADWSAVYMKNNLQTSAGMAATGYAAYSLTMTIGRLTGDKLRAWLGSVRLVRISATLATVGLAAGLILEHPIAALVGFACVGLGLSNIVPIIFSASGNVPGVNAGTGIAAVASIGYLGTLAGPPLIGFAADAITLPLALGILVLIMASVAVFANRLKTEAR
jgi:predicted MFS family arabinose efflux permease